MNSVKWLKGLIDVDDDHGFFGVLGIPIVAAIFAVMLILTGDGALSTTVKKEVALSRVNSHIAKVLQPASDRYIFQTFEQVDGLSESRLVVRVSADESVLGRPTIFLACLGMIGIGGIIAGVSAGMKVSRTQMGALVDQYPHYNAIYLGLRWMTASVSVLLLIYIGYLLVQLNLGGVIVSFLQGMFK